MATSNDSSTTLGITMIDSSGSKTTKRFTGLPYEETDLGLKSLTLTYTALTDAVAKSAEQSDIKPVKLD